MNKSFLVIGHIEGDTPLLRVFNTCSPEKAEEAMESFLAKENDIDSADICDKVFIDYSECLESAILLSGIPVSNKSTFLFIYHIEDGEYSLLPISATSYRDAEAIFEEFANAHSDTVHFDGGVPLSSIKAISC